jgi:hypothetical protein
MTAVVKRSGAEQRSARCDQGEVEQQQPWLAVHDAVFWDGVVVHCGDSFVAPRVGAEQSKQGGSTTSMPSARTTSSSGRQQRSGLGVHGGDGEVHELRSRGPCGAGGFRGGGNTLKIPSCKQ